MEHLLHRLYGVDAPGPIGQIEFHNCNPICMRVIKVPYFCCVF